MAPGPLHGVKVLDLSRLLPGPYATLILAELGAEVVKVEDPAGGDYLRWMPPIVREQSALFHALNRNKRSIAVNLKAAEGPELLRRLVASGWDVVVESFRPGVLDRLGLGYEALRAVRPEVVLCSISGYGQEGPLRARAGHDLNYVGRAGVLAANGATDGPPVPLGVQVGDVGGGSLTAVIGVLAALFERQRTAQGRWVDVSMTEGALAFLSMQLAAASVTGHMPERGSDPLAGGYPCYGVYETRDGRYMSLAALEPQFWIRFCRAVDREDLATDGLATGEDGVRVRAEVAGVFASHTQAEWIRRLADVDCCCEPVWEGLEVLEDPQLRHRGAFLEVDDPVEGRLHQVAGPVRFQGGAPIPPRPAPGLGAHTDEVLGEAGVGAGERARLREAGVLP